MGRSRYMRVRSKEDGQNYIHESEEQGRWAEGHTGE